MSDSTPIAPHLTEVIRLFSLKHPDLPQATRYFSTIVPKLGSSQYEKLFQISQALSVHERRYPSVTGPQLYSRIQAAISSDSSLGSFASIDICAMIFVVLMEAAQSASQDLQQVMAETKAQTVAKQALRQLISQVGQDVAQNSAQGIAPGPAQSPYRQSAIRVPRRW
jgi:hypothetical protein